MQIAAMSETADITDETLLLKARVAELEERVAVLLTQISWLRKQMFGAGKGEKVDLAQLEMKLGELDALLEQTSDAGAKLVQYERVKNAREKRPVPAEVFAHLPVAEVVEILPEEVKAEPEAYERIGEEKTFEVDVTPPKLFKREIVRPKFRRTGDREQPPVVAPAPARPVTGGYASAGLLAWIALSKYVDHLPLYRLEQMSERWGAKIPRNTMSEWIRIASDWLEPIYKRMRQRLLESGYIQVDETPVRFIDPDEKGGKTEQGYLWVMGAPGGDVVFDWQLSRKHDHLTGLVGAEYKGVLQSDGYEAYAAYAKKSEGRVIRVGCWAHARRKFFESLGENRERANAFLALIGKLYAIEHDLDGAKDKHGEPTKPPVTDPALRVERRAKEHPAIFTALETLAKETLPEVRPKSVLGLACAYMLSQWAALTAVTAHGAVRLDNNLVENAIRPSAVGKKNWLFIGHPDAGQRTAIIYSIVVSCQRHGVDPHLYLRDVLTKLPRMTTRDDLDALLPCNWKAS
jgi:transposase